MARMAASSPTTTSSSLARVSAVDALPVITGTAAESPADLLERTVGAGQDAAVVLDGDGRPLASQRILRPMRFLVIIGVIALVLPGILVTLSTATRTADVSCGMVVQRDAPFAIGSEARFELVGPEGPSWYCYAEVREEPEILVAALGLIPGAPPPPQPDLISS